MKTFFSGFIYEKLLVFIGVSWPAFVVLNDHWLPHFGHAHVTKYFFSYSSFGQVSCKVAVPLLPLTFYLGFVLLKNLNTINLIYLILRKLYKKL